MITEYARLSGLDKAAILFDVLGDGLALTLIKGLSEADVRRIRAHAREMPSIALPVKRRVMEEFYLSFLTRKFKDEGKADVRRPFAFLDALGDEQLGALLEVEEPRIIAIAAAQVSEERRMFVMNRLSAETKGRVLMEMGNLEDISLEAVVNIATQLEEKSHFLPRALEFSRGGGKSIAEILGRMPTSEEQKYLEAIARESPELARDIKRFHLTFEDIFALPDAILRDVLNAVELDKIAMALKGQPKERTDKVMNNLPQKKQAMFEAVQGPVPRRDVEAAQKLLVDAAKQMEQAGRFKLEDMLAGATGGSEMIE